MKPVRRLMGPGRISLVNEPILIWGAGAIGGLLGAYWARAGIKVQMVDIVAEHAVACSASGLTIEGPVDTFTQVVPCVTPDRLKGRFKTIVLAVKAHATQSALLDLLPHLQEDGIVISAQNGLNERIIAAHVGTERTLGAFVNFGADWQAPGRILFGNRGAVVVGELDGSIRNRSEEIHALMQIFEPDAELSDNIWGHLWGKLGYVAMLFATALTHDSMSANFADPKRAGALIALAREVMATAHAEGVFPLGFDGFDSAAFAPESESERAHASLAALAEFNSKTAKTHSGMYRDLAVRKRRTEIDSQIGAVIEIAASYGISTPLLTRLVELIHDIEAGRRAQSAAAFDALTEFLT